MPDCAFTLHLSGISESMVPATSEESNSQRQFEAGKGRCPDSPTLCVPCVSDMRPESTSFGISKASLPTNGGGGGGGGDGSTARGGFMYRLTDSVTRGCVHGVPGRSHGRLSAVYISIHEVPTKGSRRTRRGLESTSTSIHRSKESGKLNTSAG